MNAQERKSTFSLAAIYAFRMLGLFMILPVFSVYAPGLTGATPTLIGLALGVYGLTQALLQIPFGMSSDRIGRKPVIIFGLILLALGSLIAAEATSISMMIIGRALQGSGAIGSTLIAFVADSTEDENRLKAMSLIGMTIGFSFMLAIMLGPLINAWAGIQGIFGLTALLAVLGIGITIWVIPTPPRHLHHRDSTPLLKQLKTILSLPELLRLDFGIFSLHALLMALFMAIPTLLTQHLGLALSSQWKLYLPILLISCCLMLPFVIISEAKRLLKPFFLGAISLLCLIEGLLAFLPLSLINLSTLLCLFFAAFTFLEASLPSLTSKITPAGGKGTAMGIYSSAQFLGIFFGGALGGFCISHFGIKGLLWGSSALALLWLGIACGMKSPPYLSSKIISLRKYPRTEWATLKPYFLRLPGVAEAWIAEDEAVAYLKVDKKYFRDDITQCSGDDSSCHSSDTSA
jgi:MFS family permease